MTITPASPMPTANQRRGPTFSFSNGTDSAVMSSGATKTTATASASGMAARPRK